MRIPTNEEIQWMQSIEPMWQYDEKYNNFYLMVGFRSIIIDTDDALDKELNEIKMDIAEDFFIF